MEVRRGIGNISMEWKFDVFKLGCSRHVGTRGGMKELSKVIKYNRVKTCKNKRGQPMPQKQMKDACRGEGVKMSQ